jgi:hypothetical protein
LDSEVAVTEPANASYGQAGKSGRGQAGDAGYGQAGDAGYGQAGDAGHTHELPDLADDLLTAILMLDVNPREHSRGSQPPRQADGPAHAEPPAQSSPWS